MKILIANDDGINAEGIRQLSDALSEVADIYICAPHKERSGAGHGITIHNSIKVKDVDFPKSQRALSIEGTPADCVKIGLDFLQKEGVEIDVVFSGINLGPNIGTDILYSGTVAAAIEGALCGKPSAAISIDSYSPKHYDTIKELAKLAAMFMEANLDDTHIININSPDLPPDEIKGVKFVGLGIREYDEWFKIVNDDPHKYYQYYECPAIQDYYDSDSNDIGALQAGYAAITPIHIDMTDYKYIKKIKESKAFSIMGRKL